MGRLVARLEFPIGKALLDERADEKLYRGVRAYRYVEVSHDKKY